MSDDPLEPSAELILDWLEGRLPPAEAAAVERAVARPGSAAQRFAAWAEQFHRLAGELPLVDPPPVIAQRLRRLHAQSRGRTRATARLLARLDVDSRLPDAMVAVRGPFLEVTSRVQLTFTTDAADVVLDIAPAGSGTVDLRGQVLARQQMPSAFEATASGPSGSISTIEGDDQGSFVLQRVPVDADLIVVTNGEITIEIPLFPVGQPT